jgi:hypothetical protein
MATTASHRALGALDRGRAGLAQSSRLGAEFKSRPPRCSAGLPVERLASHKTMMAASQGTGSYPPGFSGWQREMRRIAIHPPWSRPYFEMAW